MANSASATEPLERQIAEVYVRAWDQSIGQDGAIAILRDCPLVAAAPDLLAALRAAEFGFNHARCPVCAGWDGEAEHDHYHSDTCMIALAIAKAEGRTHEPD